MDLASGEIRLRERLAITMKARASIPRSTVPVETVFPTRSVTAGNPEIPTAPRL